MIVRQGVLIEIEGTFHNAKKESTHQEVTTILR